MPGKIHFRRKSLLCVFHSIAIICIFGCITIAGAQTNLLRIKSFGFPELSGITPTTAPIEGSDGRLYGTTDAGGTNGYGSLYCLNKDGSHYVELHSFTNYPGAGGPQLSRLREANDGALYGVSTTGGNSNAGSLYRISRDGNGFTVLLNFTARSGDGAYPSGRIAEGTNGVLYGSTQEGGNNDVGTIYKVNKDGSGYGLVRSFVVTGTGPRQPGGLIAASDGKLYGTSFQGGSLNSGTAFRMNIDGSGLLVLHSFTGSAGDGTAPVGELTEASDGVIYGTTLFGGSNNVGTIFRVNKDGTGYRVIQSFSLTQQSGQQPRSALVEGNDGMLYGAAYGYSTFPGNDNGTLFKINKDGTGYQDFWFFSVGAGGIKPFGLVIDKDGIVYGATQMWGLRRSGTVFKINTDGTGFGVLHDFSPSGGDGQYPQAPVVSATDGKLYGTTTGGGAENLGTVFSCNSDGSGYSVLRSFVSTNGDAAEPRGPLIEGRDGILYGTTFGGGTNGLGTIFKLDKTGANYSMLHSFTFDDGDAERLQAGLLEGSDGILYGVSVNGGIFNNGTVFKIQKDGSGYAILYKFTGTGEDGRNPTASLIEGQDGGLYGTTANGGTNNTGELFKLNKDGSGYAVLHSFYFNTGAYSGQVLEGSDGALYGTTDSGGQGSGGTVYTINKDGGGFRVLHSFFSSNDTNGYAPIPPLLELPDGALYGVASRGGNHVEDATVFRLNKDGTHFEVLTRFATGGAYGISVSGGLVMASDGSLIGTALQGGDMNFGTIFKIRVPPFIITQPTSQYVNAGSDVTFSVNVAGSEPLFYQWQFNGTNIAGATHQILVLSAVTILDAGLYSVSVSNDLGSQTSASATLRVNNPPVADASATGTLLLSANGTNATAVLDGSRSFDLDGDALQYDWFLSGSTRLGTGVVAIVSLPVGTNLISLIVRDGLGAGTNTIVIEVVTTPQLVERLVNAVQSDVSKANPLIATLSAAISSIDRSNPAAAINQLQAFQNKLSAQVEPIDAQLAESLISKAQEIIDSLSNGNVAGENARFTRLVHENNGKTRLRFTSNPGKTHVIAASTNMIDWELIGVAVDAGEGTFEFEDVNTIQLDARFYRIISP